MAAVGAGVYPDLPAAAKAMVTVDREYLPDADRHAAYQFYVNKYQETYRKLRPLMRDMVQHSELRGH